MSDSISDLLKNRDNSQPKEIIIIKEYVYDLFKKEVSVIVGKDRIKIETTNSALAGELRFKIYDIQKLLGTDKKLIIMIV